MAKFQLLNPVLRVVGQKYDEKVYPLEKSTKMFKMQVTNTCIPN